MRDPFQMLRDDDDASGESHSPNSSRVGWAVAGVAGVILLAWTCGMFDVGGPETGDLVDDPLDSEFEELAVAPFDGLPEQSEPIVVPVPPADEVTDEWDAPPEPPTEGLDPPNTALREPSPEEIPGVIPPEFAVPTDPSDFRTPDIVPEDDYPVSQAGAESTAKQPLPSLERIDADIRTGMIPRAHAALSRLWDERPRTRNEIRARIDRTARAYFFDPDVHAIPAYVVRSGDSLREIGAEYAVPWQYIVRLNRVDPRRIRPGRELKVIRGPFHAEIDLSDLVLTVRNHGLYVKQYPIGIGTDAGTPIGGYVVRDKVTNPEYIAPGGKVVPANDPRNPLGERWIGLGEGCGIHGTHNPASLQQTSEAGCLRMLPADVDEVFDLLGIGSEVVVVQ